MYRHDVFEELTNLFESCGTGDIDVLDTEYDDANWKFEDVRFYSAPTFKVDMKHRTIYCVMYVNTYDNEQNKWADSTELVRYPSRVRDKIRKRIRENKKLREFKIWFTMTERVN